MYWLVKTLSLAVYPLGIAMIALAVALVLVWLGQRRVGLWSLGGTFAWLWIWSMPATGDALIGWLERDFDYRPESWSEAEWGAIFLRNLGVPNTALFLEGRARSTSAMHEIVGVWYHRLRGWL